MTRLYNADSIPSAINQEKLQAELAELGNIGLSSKGDEWFVYVIDDAVTDAQVQAVIDAHDATVKTDSQVEREELQTFFSPAAVTVTIAELKTLRNGDESTTGVVPEVQALNTEITALNAEISTVQGTVVDVNFTVEMKAAKLAELRLNRDTKVSIRNDKQAIRDLINNQLLILRMLRETAGN